ncbi:MAG: FliA/WhiG family RNA polymerase sigma factor [Firmicutes bacterium HGW-Firmicutes-1]|nr:MAG: FliA/WhiG family RNA polymerase sigma factor [Firmicutes bacterium HGW-Firmicutes-1]
MDEVSKTKLWEKYSKTKDVTIKEQLIIEYAQLVKFVAGRLSMYLGSNVEFEDLCGYGIFGLIDAIDKFDYEKGVKFETYASLRIRGSILDNIRKMDWIPRSIRKKQKVMDVAIRKLEIEHGRTATDEEISNELEISTDEYYKWMNQTKALALTSLEEYVEQGGETRVEPVSNSRYTQPEEMAEREALKNLLSNAIEGLSEKEKKVIILYYYEELTLKEISAIMGVSESRISQLHTKSLSKMKSTLGTHLSIFMTN